MIYLDSFEDYLLFKPSEEVLDLLEKFFNGDNVGFPENVNWHGFAFSASMKAQGSDAEESTLDKPDLNWAKIAVKVYEFLAVSSKSKETFENSSMMLKSSIISQLGHIDHDPILDSRNIMDWFIKKMEFSYDEICEKSSFWGEFFNRDIESKNPNEEVDFSEALKLRRLKERLSIIRILAEGENVTLSGQIKQLLEFREKLP